MTKGTTRMRSRSGRPTKKQKRARSGSTGVFSSKGNQRAASDIPAKDVVCLRAVEKPFYLGDKIRTVSAVRHYVKKASDNNAGQEADESTAADMAPEDYEKDTANYEFYDVYEDPENNSENEAETIEKPDVLNKYQAAGQVVDKVIDAVAQLCVPGANTKDLCARGDELILKETSQLYKNAYSLVLSATGAALTAGSGKEEAAAPTDVGGRAMSSGNSRPPRTVSRVRSRSTGSKRGGDDTAVRTRTLSRASSRRGYDNNPLAETFTTGVPRGIAFPFTVNINDILAHHSPFDYEDAMVLRANDVVKLHCGVHIDGFPVMAARTIIVRGDAETDDYSKHCNQRPYLSPSAVNTIEACRVTLAAMAHLLVPNAQNCDITDSVAMVAHAYPGTQPCEGVLSTRLKRWLLDSSNNSIIARRVVLERPQQDVPDCRVKPFSVWCLDMAFTNSPSYKLQVNSTTPLASQYQPNQGAVSGTAGGDLIEKAKLNDTTIFRRSEVPVLSKYTDHRCQSATDLLEDEVRYKFHNFCFHPLHCFDPLRAKLAIAALRKTGLFDSFPELHCRRLAYYKRHRASAAVSAAPPRTVADVQDIFKGDQPITARFCCTVAVTDRRLLVLAGGQGLLGEAGGRGGAGFVPAEQFFAGVLPPEEVMQIIREGAGGSRNAGNEGDTDAIDGDELITGRTAAACINNVIDMPLVPDEPTRQLLAKPFTFSRAEKEEEAQRRTTAEARHKALIASTTATQAATAAAAPGEAKKAMSRLAAMHPDVINSKRGL